MKKSTKEKLKEKEASEKKWAKYRKKMEGKVLVKITELKGRKLPVNTWIYVDKS